MIKRATKNVMSWRLVCGQKSSRGSGEQWEAGQEYQWDHTASSIIIYLAPTWHHYKRASVFSVIHLLHRARPTRRLSRARVYWPYSPETDIDKWHFKNDWCMPLWCRTPSNTHCEKDVSSWRYINIIYWNLAPCNLPIKWRMWNESRLIQNKVCMISIYTI